MIDYTPILQALLSVLALIITGYVIPYIRTKTSQAQQERIRAMVQVAVYAAEKLYGTGCGAEKLSWASDWLEQMGIDLDALELRGYVDSILAEMELMQGEGEIISALPQEPEEEDE